MHLLESRFERWAPALCTSTRSEGSDPLQGARLLFDLGAHLVDQARVLLGPVATVAAERQRRRPGSRVDDNVLVSWVHAAGARSHLWAGALLALPVEPASPCECCRLSNSGRVVALAPPPDSSVEEVMCNLVERLSYRLGWKTAWGVATKGKISASGKGEAGSGVLVTAVPDDVDVVSRRHPDVQRRSPPDGDSGRQPVGDRQVLAGDRG